MAICNYLWHGRTRDRRLQALLVLRDPRPDQNRPPASEELRAAYEAAVATSASGRRE